MKIQKDPGVTRMHYRLVTSGKKHREGRWCKYAEIYVV